MYLPYSSRVKDQGRTKDEPRMNLRTPYPQKCCLLRLPSLLSLLYFALFYRENSDRRPSEERHNSLLTKSAVSYDCFLKRSSLFLKRLTRILKLLTVFLKTFTPFLKRFTPCCIIFYCVSPLINTKNAHFAKKLHFS